MIKNEIENMLYDMNQSLAAQGLGLQQYVEWTGKTIDELREETKPEAEKRIRTRVLLKNIISNFKSIGKCYFLISSIFQPVVWNNQERVNLCQ